MNRTEREYREALDGLRFSEDAKGRMIDNLMEQKGEKPMKKRNIRPLRTGLIAAAVCAALVGTAGAATLIAQQANVNFFDNYEEYVEAQRAKSEKDGVDYGIIITPDELEDYGELGSTDKDFWWNGEYSESGDVSTVITDEEGTIIGEATVRYDSIVQTLVEETAGTAGDGWTAKRVFQYEWDGHTYLTAKYRAEALSGYDGLWNSWDTSWLEERYTPVPDNTRFEDVERDGKHHFTNVFGEFRGKGDTVFNLQYSWYDDSVVEEENLLTTGFDHIETYTTSDGVKATISTAASHTGKNLFWVSAYFGHGSFSMFGTQVEMDELYAILDSLNLSNLLEYKQVG